MPPDRGWAASDKTLKASGFSGNNPFSEATQERLVTGTNPTGYMAINDLQLSALLDQVQLIAPKMDTLMHIRTAVENPAVQGWANRGIVTSATAVGPILRDLSFLTRTHNIYSSVQLIYGTDNKMDNSA